MRPCSHLGCKTAGPASSFLYWPENAGRTQEITYFLKHCLHLGCKTAGLASSFLYWPEMVLPHPKLVPLSSEVRCTTLDWRCLKKTHKGSIFSRSTLLCHATASATHASSLEWSTSSSSSEPSDSVESSSSRGLRARRELRRKLLAPRLVGFEVTCRDLIDHGR